MATLVLNIALTNYLVIVLNLMNPGYVKSIQGLYLPQLILFIKVDIQQKMGFALHGKKSKQD